ncbi:MAG: hypothetical protein HOW73_33345 [Polyangiaceae bacterium]|nr:hypothetical protein [Polyangiaceae bacterium]
MKRLFRPAFVVTSCFAAVGCNSSSTPPNEPTSATPTGTETTATSAPTSEVGGNEPYRDAEGRVIQRKIDGTCYVQVEKKEPPPKDLMSGERWVDDKEVACPKELQNPGEAPPDGYTWSQDKVNGDCYLTAMFGNPPPPPQKAECPPSLKKK